MHKWIFIFFLTCSSLKGQEYAPFAAFDSKNKAAYLQEKKVLERIQNERDRNGELIQLAYAFKDYEGLIQLLEKEIIHNPKKAELYYRLAGVQGIRSLEVSKIFAPPYLRGMIKNFDSALVLSQDYIPAIEAYIEVLCKIPSLFGGSVTKAEEWVQRLKKLSPIDGALAHAFVVRETQGFDAAIPTYKAVFNQLITVEFCENPTAFFQGKSINYSYKIAEMAVLTSSSSEVGLCAVDYFIDHTSIYYNIPLEWAYYRKGQLLENQGEKEKAKTVFKKALEINPNFERAKKELL